LSNFDSFGNLSPYKIIPFTLEYFEEVFLFSPKRVTIYEGYQKYSNDLLNLVPSMRHWIDGSFTTTKEEPNDIDLVCFVWYEYIVLGNYIKDEFKNFDTNLSKAKCKKVYNVDGYLVPVFPKEHKLYSWYLDRVNYWKLLFGTDRKNNPKGIVEIIYE